jgi:short subunit dehydrogenase-like uncharacterized protein
MGNRKYDILLFGSTGFTGGLVAEYFAVNVDLKKVKWAIAGRNADKLAVVKKRLEAINPACSTAAILQADSENYDSLLAAVSQAQIVVTTVGPFALHGESLVKACVEAGTNYCDITGEPEFVKSILKQYDSEAKSKGIYILNCCGFDSIPADAGAFYTAMQLPANERKTIRGYVDTKGSFSGGTYASAINAMADLSKNFRMGEKEGKDPDKKSFRKIDQKIYFDRYLHRWALPMPVIDPWMVARSAIYRKEVYGDDFAYAQFLTLKTLPQVIGLVTMIGGVMAGAQIKTIKNLLLNYRKSGEGPNKETRDKSYFKLTFIGESETKKVVTKVSGGDPGYTETSKMLSETALLLMENMGKLPLKGGVLTPAGTLGNLLIERLQSKGICFEVIE